MKKVGNCYYTHISNLTEMYSQLSDVLVIEVKSLIEYAKKELGLKFAIVKVDVINDKVSLIECPTFDCLEEPIVGDSYCFHLDTRNYKVVKGGTKVYHHKWMFVSSSYKDFNVDKSKERSRVWGMIPEMRNNKSRIGNKEYWYSLLDKYGLKK